ncbi:cell division-associated ATP-dependent zinc metalloprotease FtsH [Pseudomonas phage vB_Pa-PAC2]
MQHIVKFIKNNRFIILFLVICITGFALTINYKPTSVSINTFLSDASSGKIISVKLKEDGQTLQYVTNTSDRRKVTFPGDTSKLIESFLKAGVPVVTEEPSTPSPFLTSLVSGLIVMLVFLILMVFVLKRMGPGSSLDAKSKSKLRKIEPKDIEVTFNDVAGHTHEINEVKELVDFIAHRTKYSSMGIDVPRGILMHGSPGVGKTLLAKAMAKEANVNFFYVAGSEFNDTFVGVGANRVTDMFKKAKEAAPCIIFIDEIDALAQQRSTKISNGSDQTLNQLLVEMDGMQDNDGITILAATNRLDILDPAVIRPKRFDRIVQLSLPDVGIRQKILEINANGKTFEDNVDFSVIAKGTPGFSGAELAKLVNEAAIYAVRSGQTVITQEHVERAKDKVLMGENSTKKYTQEELLRTAYHEAGHAISGVIYKSNDNLHKVSIIPRGLALGVTVFLPNEEPSVSKEQLMNKLVTLMAGRAAEELIYGESAISTGASSDIKRATELAVYMTTSCGFGSIGPVATSTLSSLQSSAEQDAAILVKDAYNKAITLLSDKKAELKLVADLLMEKETIDCAEVEQVLA